MIIYFVLCAVFIEKIVLCDRLTPKDTSYGYVPRESQIISYPADTSGEWRPFAARDDQKYKNVASDLITHQKIIENQTNVLKEVTSVQSNDTPEIPSQPRSFKSPRFFGEQYYYDPPPPQYLPPSSDPFPSDYTTQRPTDEEFINKPPYHYEPPRDTPQDPPQGGYLPPQAPQSDLLPPFAQDEPFPDPPSNNYLPVVTANDAQNFVTPPLNAFKPANQVNNNFNSRPSFSDDSFGDRRPKHISPLHIEISEMHCFDTPNDGRFQAVLTVKSLSENMPVFDEIPRQEASSYCQVKSDVIPPRLNSKLRISIPKSQFSNCAVRDCSVGGDVVHLCMRLRFPTIPRMRLAEDALLTLQCRTQDRIAAHTKHLQLDVDNSVSGRANGGTVARGGARGGLRSRVGLYRRGSRGDWSEALPSRARVPLGELLMLKAHVEPDDGWVASRMSSITLTGGGPVGANTLLLLGPDGCRAGSARALCPREARPAPPLGHTLLIRAAMFEGMQSGEEMRLSVRMVACLDAVDCRTPRCSSRTRRSLHREPNDLNSTSTEVSFTVVLPPEDVRFEDSFQHERLSSGPLISMLAVLAATIMCSVALLFLKTKGQLCSGGRPY